MENSSFIRAVEQAKNRAHAPYSNFRVGALLLTKTGKTFSGCNIESSSYGLTICAERVALFKAISEGEKNFRQIYIATDHEQFCPPCGACRQVLWELAGDIEVTMVNRKGKQRSRQLSELLPDAFDGQFLEGQ
ncbi:MAG: cytidine deaminase [candidate division KSB1 bacterium]|jgi:cytidine deaminase|nr:cytidine deaminase [candidate division KSB1 bacterium]